ncbi:MAG TPA: AAA family ATPase [Archangium sp.]|jgi:signal transduction histidine kinase
MDTLRRIQLPQRLYGRDTHVATLLQGLERVAQGGRSELILVRGYSGIGKSSVVHELREPVVRRRGFFLSGKADQFQQHIPYATLAQAVRGLTQQLLANSDEQLAPWSERLREALGPQGQLLLDVVPQLEHVLGRQPAVPELPPSESLHRFQRLCQRFLGVFATPEHPLVLFVDDLQWIDLASLKLLQFLLTHPETPPLLLIGAYRDNEVSPSHALALTLTELRKAGVRMTDVRLEPLSREHVHQLVADSLPGAAEGTVGPLSALVHEKTGGNPFFITQLMLTLHQDGLLTRTPEGGWRWDAAGVRAKGYSDNVADFMVSRLRQLPVRTQHLLQLAACVGNVFPRHLLVIISGAEPNEVEAGLSEASREGMLVRAGPEQCRFIHDRIQQAARDLIPARDRKTVHLRIGRLLLASLSPEQIREQLLQEHRDDLPGFLTRDPRGAHLLGYLFSLAEELLREHASMKESTGKLKEHLDHMRAILQIQQAYARDSLLPEECDLSQLVEDALSIQLPALQRHGITLTREFRARPRARLDKHRMLQILINLLTNARNALSEVPETQRHLHVRLDTEGSTARIQVVDSGKGIAPEHRERLFSQGFTTRAEGQGLGLHSSALAAKSMGGRLTLDSEGPGKGATATLELPLA